MVSHELQTHTVQRASQFLTHPNKLCDAQVDIPHGARSALDTLRQQRMQKQALASAAAPTESTTHPAFAPVEDTLPPSHNSADGDGVPAPVQDTLPISADQFDAEDEGATVTDSMPMADTVPTSDVDMSTRSVGTDKAQGDTRPISVDQVDSSNAEAPVTDTLPCDSIIESVPLDDTPLR